MNRSFGTSPAFSRARLILQRLEWLCRHNETIHSPDGMFCTPALSGNWCWRDGLPEALYRECVATEFLCRQLTNCSLLQSLILHSIGHVACASIASHPWTPFHSRIIIYLQRFWRECRFIFLLLRLLLDSSRCSYTTLYRVFPHSRNRTCSATICYSHQTSV